MSNSAQGSILVTATLKTVKIDPVTLVKDANCVPRKH